MPKLSLLPDPATKPEDFRGTPLYQITLEDVARVYWDICRSAYGRRDVKEGPCWAQLRAFKDLPQAALERSSKRFQASRYVTPGYYKAYYQGEILDSGDGAACCEHPHGRRQTSELCWEYACGLLASQDSGKRLVEKPISGLTAILDSRIDTVLCLNREQWGEQKWILPNRDADGWARYTACPPPGLWDRLQHRWVQVKDLTPGGADE
jgi:hypothetical protein